MYIKVNINFNWFLFFIVNIKRVFFCVDWLVLSFWSENVFVKIIWDLGYFGVDIFLVVVFLVCFLIKDDDVYFYSMFFLKEE